jgi:hypothetical protein
MVIVKVTTTFPQWPFIRQTPGEAGQWGECKFLIDQKVPECDVWVVFDDLMREETTLCPPENIILILGEPPALRRYSDKFVSQFRTVIGQERTDIKHPNVIFKAQGHPWHVGRIVRNEVNLGFRLGYDELKGIREIPKTRSMSVICSDKQYSPGHRARVEFIQRLKNYFGAEMDVFGRGIHDIEDKWDGIAAYRYHIVIENCVCGDWVTEKLWDSYLALSFPFYHGAPNVGDYFPPESFLKINVKDFSGSVTVMKKAIESNAYEKSLVALKIAREFVLDRYNFFPMVAEVCSRLKPDRPRETVTLKPQAFFRPRPTLSRRIIHKIADRWRRIMSGQSV